ncbi:MAG: arylsulfotransferase family protein [Sphingomonas sp.]
MNLEKLMYSKLPLWLLLCIVLIGIVFLVIFGSLVSYAASGGQRLKALTRPALAIADIPLNAARYANASDEPVTHEKRDDLPPGFWRNPATPFVDPGYALIPHYDLKRNRYVVDLTRLSDGKVVRNYAPDISDINGRSHMDASFELATNHSPKRYRMTHPLLMPDGGLIFHDATPQVRTDACGRVLWTRDGIFHHANEVGPDGNIWSSDRVLKSALPHVGALFGEDEISKISPDGRLLGIQSVATILARNQLTPMWRSVAYTDDPFHLNDIEPVMTSGPNWQKGDVFLSLRNLSLVMLYRPSTGRVLWSRQGPWSMQHDVDILDDHRIAVFDNGVQSAPDGPRPLAPNGDYVVNHNRLYVYDFATGKTDSPFEAAFAAQDIRTITQGLATHMENGDLFVEETNYGRLLRMSPDGAVRWRYISTDTGGRRLELGWSRYIDPKTQGAAIRAAANARCG